MERSPHGVSALEDDGTDSVLEGKQHRSAVGTATSSGDRLLRARPPSLSPHLDEKKSAGNGKVSDHPDDRRRNGESALGGAKGRAGKDDNVPIILKPSDLPLQCTSTVTPGT